MLYFLLAFAMFQTIPGVLPSPNVRVSVGDDFALFGQLRLEGGAACTSDFLARAGRRVE